jgi:hypothetical protein
LQSFFALNGGIVDRKRILIELAIDQGKFPEIVYKYRSFDQHTAGIFKNNELWFSKPGNFNDPFDLKIYDKGGYSKEDIYKYLVSQGTPCTDLEKLSEPFSKNPQQ